jgi:hypothetical protein
MIGPLWRLRGCLLALGCTLPLGCASTTTMIGKMVNPVSPPRPEVLAVSQALPASARDHVHVFFINGFDPNHFCNFRGQYEYVQALGYRNVYFGQMWDSKRCLEQIRLIRGQDSAARVVIIGYSAGVYLARDMTNDLGSERTRVDVLVYLGGDVLTDSDKNRPANAERIVNVRGWGMVLLGGGLINGAELKGSENVYIDKVWHNGLPSDQRVLELLARELATQAAATQADR